MSSSQTTITILCENTASAMMGITGEHGFSALVEKNGRKLLLDTGQGLTLQNNARVLGVDLSTIDKVAISHGHMDHTGGLSLLFFPKRNVEVVAHPDIFIPKYAGRMQGHIPAHFFIGIKDDRHFLEDNRGLKFSLKAEYEEIEPGIFFSGEVARVTDFEKPDAHLEVKQEDGFVQDPLRDDASLLIETNAGPVILTGCAHAGIVNVMEHFKAKSGHDTFHAVIGGTHLGFLNSKEQLEQTMDAFDRFKVQKIAVSHCTGNVAAAACYNRFKERFDFANAGWRIIF